MCWGFVCFISVSFFNLVSNPRKQVLILHLFIDKETGSLEVLGLENFVSFSLHLLKSIYAQLHLPRPTVSSKTQDEPYMEFYVF